MDEVEIKNVGGIRGVASEATLQLLVDAVRQQGKSGSGQQTAIRLQELHNRALKSASTETGIFEDALGGAADTLKSFAKEVAIGGERLTDFSGALFGFDSVITKFISYVDKTIDQYRELSSVGASFNNSIFEMIRVSGEASMTLDSFVQMVRANSQELAKLGGTVTQGSKFIAQFSSDIRLGIGARFFEMGMTIEGINEGLISYLNLETMRGRKNLRNDATLQASAANYIMQLDKLAKLTGMQKDALMDAQVALQTDAQVRNQIARVERLRGTAAAEELRSIYTLQSQALPEFQSALMDLSDGVAQTDLARALGQIAPGLTEFQNRVAMGDVTQEEYLRAMQTQFIPAIEAYARTVPDATLQTWRSLGGFHGALAQAIDGSYQFANIMNLNSEAAEQEQRRQNRLNATLGAFEQGIIALRKFFFNEFINSPFADKLGQFGTYLIELFDENSPNGLGRAREIFSGFFDRMFGEDGIFTRGIEWLTEFIQSGGISDALDWFANTLESIGNWITSFVSRVRINGLWTTIKEEFGRLMDYIFGTIDEDTGLREGGLFSNLFDGTLWEDFLETVGIPDALGPDDTLWKRFLRALGIENMPGEGLVETLKNAVSELFSGNMFRRLFYDLGRTIELAITSALSNLGMGMSGESATRAEELRQQNEEIGRLETEYESEDITDARKEEIAARLRELGVPGYATGTNGFQNFGSGTPAILHNTEAVVPRNTPAGELLDAFYRMNNGEVNPSDLAAQQNKFSQSDQAGMIDKLNELNTNIVTMVSIMQESVAVQQRTMRNLKGIGTDMYRGAGL